MKARHKALALLKGTWRRLPLLPLACLSALAPAESSWTKPSYGIEAYWPTKADRIYVLTGLTASSMVKPAKMPSPLLRGAVQGGVWAASGERDGFTRQVTPGLTAAGTLTLIHPIPRQVRPFLEGSLGFAYFLEPFPSGGSKVNGFVRWGIGVEAFVDEKTVACLSLRQAHISNGGGLTPSNPSWDGLGLGLTIRRRK